MVASTYMILTEWAWRRQRADEDRINKVIDLAKELDAGSEVEGRRHYDFHDVSCRSKCMTASAFANVRFGSEADMAASSIDVCFASESGHQLSTLRCPLCAKSRHSALR